MRHFKMIELPSDKEHQVWEIDQIIILALIYQCIHILQNPKKRCVWIKTISDERLQCSVYCKILPRLKARDPIVFKHYIRFPVRIYESIQDISPMLIKKDSPWRKSLSLEIKLMITLRQLASGMSYVDLALEFCVANNTISKIVREVCNAIVLTYNEQYLECQIVVVL